MKHLKQLINVLVLFFVLLGLAVVLNMAYGKVQKFNLEEKVQEQVFVCLDKDMAIQLVDLAAKDREQMAMLSQSLQMMGICGVVPLELVYKKQVYRLQAGDTLYTVYEAVSGEVTVYVPLKDYEHRGDI